MPTIKMNEDEIKKFITTFNSFLKEPTNEYMSYFLQFKGGSVSIYKSGKVVFQGSDLSMFNDYLNEEIDEDDTPYDYMNTIGADEVGTGDSFGPIVCAACFIEAKDVEKLKSMGIKDSKKISDDVIKKLGEYLIKNHKFKANILRNEIYNDISNKYNMNEMKARLHDQNIKILTSKVKYEAVCLDEFVNREKYFSYLTDPFKDISFEMKGESKSIAVASASIIARYYFLLEMERLDKEYGYHFIKGSSKDVQELIEKIKADGNEKILYHTAKMNFKNFND